MRSVPAHATYLASPKRRRKRSGTVIQARREEEGEEDYEVVDDFEDWEVAGLFGGELPLWPPEGVAMQRIQAALLEARPLGKSTFATVTEITSAMVKHMAKKCPDAGETEPDTPLLRQYSSMVSDWRSGPVMYAERAVPGTIIRAGDFLRYGKCLAKKPPEVVGGAVTLRVPRSQLRIVDDHFGNVQVLRVPFSPGSRTWESNLARDRESLRRPQRPNWSDDSSPLVIVRPLVSPVSSPIEAQSGAGAIFEATLPGESRGAGRSRGLGTEP